MEFIGRYIEVTPHSLLVWTNDEGGEGGASRHPGRERGTVMKSSNSRSSAWGFFAARQLAAIALDPLFATLP
jgi:hypothetical protein